MLHVIVLRHFYLHVCYRHCVKDGFHKWERNRDYRWVYTVKNVICVENRIGSAKCKVQNGVSIVFVVSTKLTNFLFRIRGRKCHISQPFFAYFNTGKFILEYVYLYT